MALARLSISSVRNVRQADFCLSPGLNLLLGANGSGKSSVLEAIHFLSQGKSFRAGNSRQLISYGVKELTVVAGLQDNNPHGGATHQVGVSLCGGSKRRRIDGRNCDRQSEIAALLPVLILQPSAQILLESSPDLRRRYLDWGAFQLWGSDFLTTWKRYSMCLERRSALLRGGSADRSSLMVWEAELCRYAVALADARSVYLSRLMPYFLETARVLLGNSLSSFVIHYERGWSMDVELLDALANNREKDRRLGFTSVGPHRCDFRLSVDDVSVRQYFSRGQLKLAVATLKIAQARLAQEACGVGNVCLLIDDLSAELDTANRGIFLNYLQQLGIQALVTGTAAEQFTCLSAGADTAMFHVEHGAITPVENAQFKKGSGE